MKSFLLTAALCVGAVAASSLASATTDSNGFNFDVSGEEPSALGTVSFVNEDGSPAEIAIAAAQGGSNFGVGATADKDKDLPQDPVQSIGTDGGSPPTVPVPAPVLIAVVGLAAVVFGRNQLHRFAGR